MESEKKSSSQSCKAITTAAPVGVLHVLVVDDDTTCLAVVAAALKTWKYEVVTAKHPSDALSTLRGKRGLFDLVVTDIHMPDMNGFELQKQVEEEFKLPVVTDDKESVIQKGLAGGAAFFIVKPVKVEELKKIWQYAVTLKKGRKLIDMEKPRSGLEPSITEKASTAEDLDSATSFVNEEKRSRRDCKRKGSKRGNSALGGDEKSESMPKKTKVVWTNALHNRFLEAVRKIGLEKAVPKKILELMNVPGLTRENIASHLQKYRMFLRRVSDASNSIEQQYLRASFQQGFGGNLPIVGAPLLSSERFQEVSTTSSTPQFGNLHSHSFSNQPTSSQQLPLAANINPNNHNTQTSLFPSARVENQLQMHQPQPSQAIRDHFNSTTFRPHDPSLIQGVEGKKSLKTPSSGTNNYVGIRITSNGELFGPTCLKDVEVEAQTNGLISGDYGLTNMVQNGSTTTTTHMIQEMSLSYVGSETSSQFSRHFVNVDQLAASLGFPEPLQMPQNQQNSVGKEGGENNHMLGLMESLSTFGNSHLLQSGGNLEDVISKHVNGHCPIGGQDGAEIWNPSFPSPYYVEESHPRNELQSLDLQGELGANNFHLDDNFHSLDQYLNQGGGDEELMSLVFSAGLCGGGDNYFVGN